MLTSTLIMLREGLEAALIVGILLSALHRLDQREKRRTIWIGVAAATILSVGVAVLLTVIDMEFEGIGEQIFEGVTMILAACILTWMIFWMQKRSRGMRGELEDDLREALKVGTDWALFSLAFVAVLREGIEAALIMTAALMNTSAGQTVLGGTLGLAGAIAVGWLIFVAGKRMNVKLFFQITSIILLLFAAGLVSSGIHEFQEAAIFPPIIAHVWNINPILSQDGTVGQFLSALFGYNSSPSLLESLVYGGYLLVVGASAWLISRPRPVEELAG